MSHTARAAELRSLCLRPGAPPSRELPQEKASGNPQNRLKKRRRSPPNPLRAEPPRPPSHHPALTDREAKEAGPEAEGNPPRRHDRRRFPSSRMDDPPGLRNPQAPPRGTGRSRGLSKGRRDEHPDRGKALEGTRTRRCAEPWHETRLRPIDLPCPALGVSHVLARFFTVRAALQLKALQTAYTPVKRSCLFPSSGPCSLQFIFERIKESCCCHLFFLGCKAVMQLFCWRPL